MNNLFQQGCTIDGSASTGGTFQKFIEGWSMRLLGNTYSRPEDVPLEHRDLMLNVMEKEMGSEFHNVRECSQLQDAWNEAKWAAAGKKFRTKTDSIAKEYGISRDELIDRFDQNTMMEKAWKEGLIDKKKTKILQAAKKGDWPTIQQLSIEMTPDTVINGIPMWDAVLLSMVWNGRTDGIGNVILRANNLNDAIHMAYCCIKDYVIDSEKHLKRTSFTGSGYLDHLKNTIILLLDNGANISVYSPTHIREMIDFAKRANFNRLEEYFEKKLQEISRVKDIPVSLRVNEAKSYITQTDPHGWNLLMHCASYDTNLTEYLLNLEEESSLKTRVEKLYKLTHVSKL